jgi:CRP-like cAMP-binding protein
MSTVARQQRVEAVADSTAEPLPFDETELCAPLGNHLLASLPPGEFRRLRRHLQPLRLRGGETLADVHAAIFPVQAIVSLRTRHADGCAVEFASIGREGCFGFDFKHGDERLSAHAMASAPGLAFTLASEPLSEEEERGSTLSHLLLRQAHVVLAQAAILCACHRRHSLEQQLARWLLTSFDRLQGNELVVTQEMIAGLLGVRREGVTEAARRLQKDGLIEYRRGHVFLVRRDGLAARACECYPAIRRQLERSLPR